MKPKPYKVRKIYWVGDRMKLWTLMWYDHHVGLYFMVDTARTFKELDAKWKKRRGTTQDRK